MPAGEYKVQAVEGEKAYVEISNDSRGRIVDIIMDDNFEGNKDIILSYGQYLTLKRAAIE